MITINGENELVDVGSPTELRARPRFTDQFNPSEKELTKLIGVYTWPEEISCGLTTCHQGHMRGFLAAAEDGTETNIGHRCGAKIFGIDNWNVMKRKIFNDIREKKQRETVLAFQARIPDCRAYLVALRDQPLGAKWAFYAIRKLNNNLPTKVLQALDRMIKEDDGRVLSERRATEAEIAEEEVRRGKEVKRPYYVVQMHGYVEGLSAMRQDVQFDKILSKDLLPGLDSIEEMNADTAPRKELEEAAKWAWAWDSKAAKVADVLDIAQHLLTKSNLMQLQHLGLSSTEMAHLRSAIAELPQSYEAPSSPRAA